MTWEVSYSICGQQQTVNFQKSSSLFNSLILEFFDTQNPRKINGPHLNRKRCTHCRLGQLDKFEMNNLCGIRNGDCITNHMSCE